MKLVLGLAALVTALSGATGSGRFISSGPTNNDAAATKAQKMDDNLFIQEKQERLIDDLVIGGGGIGGGHLTNPDILLNSAFELEVENNNTVATAMDLAPFVANGWDFSHYSSSGSPTLAPATIRGFISNEDDVDWYKFTLWGKADISIDLTNIPEECDYDLELYRRGTTRVGRSARGSNYDENISMRLYPGVYFIKVFSYDGYGSPKYNLSFSGNYVREDANIAEMTAKGAKGALWLADYDPFDIKPTTNFLNANCVGTTYHHKAWTRTSVTEDTYTTTYNPEFPYVMGRAYKQAELFVWDDSLKSSLASLFATLYTQSVAKDTNAKNLRMQAEVNENVGKACFNVLKNGAVAVISIEVPIVGWIALGVDFLVELFSAIFPKGNSFENYNTLTNYIENIWIALTCSEGNGRPIKIPAYFKVTSSTVSNWGSYQMSETTTYTLSYVPPEIPVGQLPYFVYQNSNIPAVDWTGDGPFTGTVYPLFDGESSEKAWNRETYDMSYETFNNNSQKTSSLSRGQYKWYKFTAPQNGTYYFMSKGDEETTIDIFDNMVYGKSDYGRVSRYYKNNGVSTGVNFSLSLGEGQSIYLRVSGGNGAYSALSSTTLKISNTRFPSVFARINAWDLEVPMNLDNPFFFNFISVGNQYNLYVSSVGAFYNTERGAIELLCDRDNNKPFAFLIMLFDRPIKQINFGNAVGNSYSYAHLGLYLQGLNQYGFPVTEDIADNYGNSYLLPCNVRYDNRDEAIYGVMFRIDPETDTSPYHVGYQESLIGDFVVEFNDY